MQKWEYLFVGADYAEDQWRPRYVNGQERKGWARGANLAEFSNQMGDEGWEIIAAPYTSDPGESGGLSPRLIFKRPKPVSG